MKRYILLGIFCVLIVAPMWAHPHMFIDSQVTAVFDKKQFKGFWVEWKFDPMFTASIRLDYDRNRDGEFNDREVKLIEQNAFANLKNYHYFTTISYGDTEYQVDQVTRFSAWMEEERLVYKFFVPHSIPVSQQRNKVRLIIFDETFFCDIVYQEQNPVSIDGRHYVSAHAEIQKNRDAVVTYDPTGGMSRDNGGGGNTAGRAYPYELYLTFSQKWNL